MTQQTDHPWYVTVLAVVMAACGLVAAIAVTAILAWVAWHVVVP